MFSRSSLLFLSGVLVATGLGCSPQPASAPAEDKPIQSVMTRLEAAQPMDIGDVESDVRLEITLDESMGDAGIAVEEMRTAMDELSLTRIDLPWPPPEQLLLHCNMRYNNNYKDTPVSADIRLLLDEVVMANEGGILAGRSFENPLAFVVDVFENLEEFPETMLVHAEVELGFFPGENESTVRTETTTKLSNPVRINFAPRPGDAELVETVDPVEATVEDGDTDTDTAAEEAAP